MTKASLLSELKRRNVFRMAGLYLVAAWVITQVAATLLPGFEAPPWVFRVLVLLIAIGFVAAVVFAWVYEITPEGIKRESEVERDESITSHTGRRIDRAIVTLLALAIVVFAVDRFVIVPKREAARDAAAETVSETLSASSASPPVTTASAETVSDTVSAPPQASIAVLPFVNMSDDKANEYFSDGISEELLNLLAKIPQLQVTARTSSFAFKGKETGIPEIARTLHVAHVLEGSVRKSGNSVRITAQLIKAETGNHLWSQTYDRQLDDIFAIQDEIAADVVKQLEVTLLGAVPKARATDPHAYAMYLQAVQLNRQNKVDSLTQSDALYRKVLEIDPRYAAAWDGLADNFYRKVGEAMLPSKEGLAQARDMATKALEIEPEYAPAHARLGRIANADNDLVAAARHLKRALEIDPADFEVQHGSAVLLTALGRIDEAALIEEALVRRDPVNVYQLYYLGLHQRNTGRFDAAVASQRTVLSLSPGRGGAHAELGLALLSKGDAQGALREIEQETSETWRLVYLPIAYHGVGRKADSDAALAALIAKLEKGAPFNIAYVYAFRGEADKAFEWLDKAVEYNDPGLSEIVMERLFDPIKSDPRWLPFLRKVGKAPEQLAQIEFKVTLPQ